MKFGCMLFRILYWDKNRNTMVFFRKYDKRCIFGLLAGVCAIWILQSLYFTSEIRPPAPLKRINDKKRNWFPKQVKQQFKENWFPKQVKQQSKESRFSKQGNQQTNKTRLPKSAYEKNATASYLLDQLKELEVHIQSQLDVTKTTIEIIGKKTIFSLGDLVKLRITLHKKDGSPRLTGGDQLRVRLFEDKLNASASGQVVDHGNGSHTALVKCLWTGSPTISIYLNYMAEVTEALQGYLAKVPDTRTTYAVYTNGDTGRCHTFKNWLTNSRDICNMTSRNGGMSWYCELPTSRKQTCADFKHYKWGPYDKSHGLFGFSHGPMTPVQITVKGKTKFVKPSKLPCSRYNKAKLWTMPSPIGYFYQNKWKLLHCTTPSSGKTTACLRDKHLVMYGDSTVRQWFVEINRRLNCTFVTEKWIYPQWSIDSKIYCRHRNLTIELIFHAQPGNHDPNKLVFESVSRHMLKFYKRTDVIFLIYLLNHFEPYHTNVYWERIRHISKSVRKIVEGNPNSKIVFKGGHTNWYIYNYKSDLDENILSREVIGVHDKLIYLDNKDITMAKLVKDPHPPVDIVSVMVDHMLGYICN